MLGGRSKNRENGGRLVFRCWREMFFVVEWRWSVAEYGGKGCEECWLVCCGGLSFLLADGCSLRLGA